METRAAFCLLSSLAALALCACADDLTLAHAPATSGASAGADASVLADASARADTDAPPSTASPQRNASNQVDAGSISEHVADAAAPEPEAPWCCLEQELEWHYSSFGWVHPRWHLTREGVLEPMPYAPTVPGEMLTTDVADCGRDRVCLRDLHEALRHPDVVALFPDGKRFHDSIVLDGTAVFLDVGGTPISFGLPYFDDLPDGLKPLYEVLLRLELQNLQDVVPSCASARVSPPSFSSGLDEPIWVLSAYLGVALEFESCEAAMQCECAARPLVDASFGASDCSSSSLAIAETCRAAQQP